MICVEYFFPKTPARNDMVSARKLRRSIIPLIVLHFLIAVVACAFVTVGTGLVQIWYMGLLYSTYMTLRTWLLWVYLICLGFNCLVGLLSFWVLTEYAFWAYLGIISLYAIMFVCLYYSSEAWRNIDNSDYYLQHGV